MTRASQSSKILLMFTLLCVDLALNSSFDYDTLGISRADFLLVILGLQVVVEISIFLALFLAMAETFLFRVGLLGFLIKKFRFVLILNPVYLSFTIAAGILRVHILSTGGTVVDMWKNSTFVGISITQKLGNHIFVVIVFNILYLVLKNYCILFVCLFACLFQLP